MDPRLPLDLASSLADAARRRVRGRRINPSWGLAFEVLVGAMKRSRARIDALDVPGQRAAWDRLATPSPALKRVRVSSERVGGVPCRVVEPLAAPASAPTVIFFHGGGYIFGSFETHGAIVARIAASGGLRVVFPEYRLAPEHPFPAAIDDARAVYTALTAEGEPVAVAGDSAGGGLSASLCILARDEGLAAPAGAVLMSPFVDQDAWDEVNAARAEMDWVTVPWGQSFTGHYVSAAHDPAHPLISPARAELSGLPPMLVQIGDAEILYEQTLRFVERARAAAVDVEVDVERGMVHSYQAFADLLPTCGASIDRAARFLRRSIARSSLDRK